MKIKVNFEREFPSPTLAGCCYATLTLLLGFSIKSFYDYVDTKNQFLKNIKVISFDLKHQQNLLNVVDAISYANQLGRLDIVSLILAILGLVLGFGAIFGFMHIKESSRLVARDAVHEWLSSERGQIETKEMLGDVMKNGSKIEGNINKDQSIEREINKILDNLDVIDGGEF